MANPDLTLNEPITHFANATSYKETKPYKGYLEDSYSQQLFLLIYALYAGKVKRPTLSAFDQFRFWERMQT